MEAILIGGAVVALVVFLAVRASRHKGGDKSGDGGYSHSGDGDNGGGNGGD